MLVSLLLFRKLNSLSVVVVWRRENGMVRAREERAAESDSEMSENIRTIFSSSRYDLALRRDKGT